MTHFEGYNVSAENLALSMVAPMIKNLPAMQETWVQSLGLGRSPGGGHGSPLQYSCLGNAHRQRSLAVYSPWGHKESDATERLSTALHNTAVSASFCVPTPNPQQGFEHQPSFKPST